MLRDVQALGAALTEEQVPENVRKQVALSIVQLQHQTGNNGIAPLLHALPVDQQSALAALSQRGA
jgi:hypothetical protein